MAVILFRRRTSRFPLAVAAAVMVGLGVGSTLQLPASMAPTGAQSLTDVGNCSLVHFGLCHSGGGTNCVVEGDTFWMEGAKIRIADIDAPETHPSRCAEEARLGDAATERLQALLNAGPVELASADRESDRYGRKLRFVTSAGQSVGQTLVDEGLARPWEGQHRPWCGASA